MFYESFLLFVYKNILKNNLDYLLFQKIYKFSRKFRQNSYQFIKKILIIIQKYIDFL